jgi:hypothetical protein
LPNNGVIKGKDGKVVNDLSKFEFIKQDQPAPDTVNPSLWRVSQLLMNTGLFEVVPGVYQVRGADLANMTIVEGDAGITIYDPLTSAEAARFALDLYYQHRPRKPVVAVVHSHSPADHVGGVRGVIDEADVKAGKVKIYAPEGFLDAYIAENVYARVTLAMKHAAKRSMRRMGLLSMNQPVTSRLASRRTRDCGSHSGQTSICGVGCDPVASSLVIPAQSVVGNGSLQPNGPTWKNHAHDCGNADQKQQHRSDERQRHREVAFSMDKPGRYHCLALLPQAQHELQVVQDARDQHQDSERDQTDAEIARRR